MLHGSSHRRLPFVFIKAYQKLQASFIRPKRDCTRGGSFHQADREALVQASQALCSVYHSDTSARRGVYRNVVVHVLAPCGALDLDALADEVEGEDGRFGNDAGDDAGSGVAAAPGQVEVAEPKPQAFVGGEEDTHEGDDLGQRRPEAAEEALESLVALDVPQRPAHRRVDAMPPLSREPRPQQVQRVRSSRGRRSGDGAGDKRFGGVGQARGQAILEEDGHGAVRGELHGRVAHVHEFCGHVALPQARDALILEDVLDGIDGAAVGGRLAQGRQGVG